MDLLFIWRRASEVDVYRESYVIIFRPNFNLALGCVREVKLLIWIIHLREFMSTQKFHLRHMREN